jgi:hypothetical protein
VRSGADAWLPRDRKTGHTTHRLPVVYAEMLGQICLDYSTLPDPRTLTLEEIRFFYNISRAELKRRTKPQPKKK